MIDHLPDLAKPRPWLAEMIPSSAATGNKLQARGDRLIIFEFAAHFYDLLRCIVYFHTKSFIPLSHDAFIMSLQMPAPTPVQKASRNRMRQKYSAAKTFFLTILVISAITILSVFNERRIQYDINDAHHAHISRTHLAVRDGLTDGSSGELLRRDEAVSSLGLSSRKEFHEA